jgi:CelD/BcsL family acetyltransferase involved in cellulose biosynthesis
LDRVRAAGGDFTSGLSANARSAIRRSLRAYETLGGAIEVHFAQDVDEALSMLDELAEHHRETWAARGQPGCFASSKFTAFHRQLIRRTFDSIMLVRVQAGKEVIGLLYCFVWQGSVHSYQSGFHYTLDSRRSPGLVTNYCVIRECTQMADIREFDLMAGETRYKRSLAGDAKSRPMYWLSIYRNTLPSRLYRFLRTLKRKYL